MAQQIEDNLIPLAPDTINIIKTRLRSVPGDNLYGSNNTWNFLFLDAPFVEELLFLNPQLGSASGYFDDADVMTLSGNGEEIYYKSSNGNVIEVGRFGPNEWFLGDKFLVDYTTAPVIKKKEQKLNSRYNDYSMYHVDIPISKLSKMGIELNMPLSTNYLRFQFEIEKNITFDAEGDLLLPFGNYNVLRSREELTIFCKLMKPSEMGWEELSENYYVINNPKIKIGQIERTNFYFWTQAYKIPILSIEQSGPESFDIQYINENKKSNLPKLDNTRKDVVAYPNPTFGEITFQLMNYPSGLYTLRIYDVVNKPKHSQEYYVRDNGKISTNLGFLREGTYLYSIIDQYGKKITTKRVVIIRP
jgi:hypothetical protein